MPFRFRRTFKILPGVKINVSKSGMSVTVGPKGYHLTFGKQGVRQTIDFPGEGLSHTSFLFKDDDNNDKKKESNRREKRDDNTDDDHGVGCFPWGCLTFVVILAVGGYFVADAYHLVPPDYLSNLLEQATQWVKNAGL